MSRYIDREKLCELARNCINKTVDCNDIMRFPIADVQEVRHAQWRDATPPRFYACSYCGCAGHSIYKFCPWCGAKMDGREMKKESKIMRGEK